MKHRVDLAQVMTKFPDRTQMVFSRPLQSFVISTLPCFGGKRRIIVLYVPDKAIKLDIALNTFQELCDHDVSQQFRFSVADDGFSKLGRWPISFCFSSRLFTSKRNAVLTISRRTIARRYVLVKHCSLCACSVSNIDMHFNR